MTTDPNDTSDTSDAGHPVYLMCPPVHYEVAYEINPFMHIEIRADPEKAQAQWDNLRAAIVSAGGRVVVQPPEPEIPDLVFTANAGLVVDGVAVPARFRHPERRVEEEPDARWFANNGFSVKPLPTDEPFEGAGDAFVAGPLGCVLAGYRWRTSIRAHDDLATALKRPVRSVALADERFYHLDLALLPVGPDRALAVGPAFDRHSARVITSEVAEVEEMTLDEGLAFAANAVVVGRTVVMHEVPVRVGKILESWGYDLVEAAVGEFQKAGGSCRCLTLYVGTVTE